MNTLMAGAMKVKNTRGKYTAAGYAAMRDRQMYIADVPAGSAQDSLRDLNRLGYRSDRPWRETPAPVFETEAAAAAAPAPEKTVRKGEKKLTLIEWLIMCAKREKKDVIACVVLTVVIMMMVAAGGQKLVAGVQIQRGIASYQTQTSALVQQNERLAQRLELARSGERIRNLAQNELNMLRPERAEHETIYIQAPAMSAQEMVQQNGEPRMELLDILLGLLNVLHIGE